MLIPNILILDMKSFRLIALLAAASIFALPALAASNITGTVTNKTSNKPSAGDDVTLIKLAQGMQEAAHTKTDARGRFTLPLDDGGTHLVRVNHQGANYFRPAPPGTGSVDLDVYDAAPKVDGVSGEADVMRIQADKGSIEVTQLWAVQNESNPPRTQFSEKAFEVYLPAGAQITGGAALGPGGMPVQAAPTPLGEPGHYAFIFPVRPGETRFQVSYKLPYTGSFQFSPKVSLPTSNLAIMLPKSMKFSNGSPAFQAVNDDVNAQVYLVRDAKPGQALTFEISGTGQMPPDPQAGAGDQPGGAVQTNSNAGAPGTDSTAAATPGAADNRPGGGLGNPIDTPDPLHTYRWAILSAIAFFFAVGIWFAMRKPTLPRSDHFATVGGASYVPTALSASNALDAYFPGSRTATPQSLRSTGSALLDALKEELFALETERLEGKLTEEEYATNKSALEIVLRRALQRNVPSPQSSSLEENVPV